jgi:hypothetical protein
MPDIITEMLIKIGADIADLKKGQAEVDAVLLKTRQNVEQQGKHIEEAGKRAAEFFRQMRDAALEFLSVFTAGKGFTEFLEYITEVDAGVSRLSTAMGLSTRDMQLWGAASQAMGGSAHGMEQAIGSLVTRFAAIKVTGDTSIVPFLSVIPGQLKTAADGTLDYNDTLVRLRDVLLKWPKANAAAFLQSMGLGNPDVINLLTNANINLKELLTTYQKYIATQRDLDAATDRQMAFNQLSYAWQELGRMLITWLTPAILSLTKALTGIADWAIAHPDMLHAIFLGALAVIGLLSADVILLSKNLLGFASALGTGGMAVGGFTMKVMSLASWFFKLAAAISLVSAALSALDPNDKIGSWIDKNVPGASWLDNLASRIGFGRSYNDQAAAAAGALAPDEEAYIRARAARYGIDPDVAVSVARSEGLGGSYSGDQGSSFGPYQLHLGGLAPGGNAVSGLGDIFKNATGLDPRDPSTWKQQIDFALSYAAAHGWGAFHGAARSGLGAWAGIGAAGAAAAVSGGASYNNSSQTVVHTGDIHVHAPNSGDPLDIARRIKERIPMAFGAQSGLN